MAAFDNQIEWLVVKGVADYADGAELTTENWRPFASVMAASVVKHIINESATFSSWPHCGGMIRGMIHQSFFFLRFVHQ